MSVCHCAIKLGLKTVSVRCTSRESPKSLTGRMMIELTDPQTDRVATMVSW